MFDHNLVLKRVDFENFKSFVGVHSLQLDRQPGLYFVAGVNNVEPDLGANGAGKSTIWDGVFWALTGKTLRVARPGDSIVPWEHEKSHVSVCLVFDRAGEEHTILRTRAPNSLRLDSREVDQKQVDKVVGISEEAIRRTLVIGQFATLFLDLRAEQQSSLFTELLELDYWLSRSDMASTKAKDFDRLVDESELAIERLEGQREAVEGELKSNLKLKDEWASAVAAKVVEFEAEQQRLEANLAEARQRQAAVPGAQVEAELQQLTETVAALTPGLRTLRTKLANGAEELAGTVLELKQVNGSLAEYEGSRESSVCPACGQTVSVAHIEDKIKTLTRKRSPLVRVVDKRRLEVAADREKVAEIEKDISKKDEQIRQLRREMDTRSRALQAISTEVSRFEYAVSQSAKGIKDLKKQPNPYVELVEVGNLKLKSIMNSLREEDTRRGDAEADAARYRFWVDGYRRIRLDIIDETLSELELAANRHMDALGLHDWRIQFDTERETASGAVTSKFSTFIFPPGQNESIPWESYSGGESTLCQLATTFALSEVLLTRAGISPNIEVLDEPSRHLSDQGISNLLEMLRERAISLGRAVYLVDHRVLDSGAFDSTLTVVRDKVGSRIEDGYATPQ